MLLHGQSYTWCQPTNQERMHVISRWLPRTQAIECTDLKVWELSSWLECCQVDLRALKLTWELSSPLQSSRELSNQLDSSQVNLRALSPYNRKFYPPFLHAKLPCCTEREAFMPMTFSLCIIGHANKLLYHVNIWSQNLCQGHHRGSYPIATTWLVEDTILTEGCTPTWSTLTFIIIYTMSTPCTNIINFEELWPPYTAAHVHHIWRCYALHFRLLTSNVLLETLTVSSVLTRALNSKRLPGFGLQWSSFNKDKVLVLAYITAAAENYCTIT